MLAVILDTGKSQFVVRAHLIESEAIDYCQKHNSNSLGYVYTVKVVPYDLWFDLENKLLKGVE